MTKTAIIEQLGESAVLLPGLLVEALAANDRLKISLSLLQEGAAHARDPARKPRGFEIERTASGLVDPAFDALVSGARALDARRFSAPGASDLLAGIARDLGCMLAPLKIAEVSLADELSARVAALREAMPAAGDDVLDYAAVSALAAASHSGPDSVHRLVMDLHRAINRLAAETAVETIQGARAHHVDAWDRERITAFMAGLNRTAPLAFGHPGLGATAARIGARLTIQNDIGETDAHVLVIHVEALAATVTYTDVHRQRARFFISMFDDRGGVWTPLGEQSAAGLAEDEPFYLVTGRFEAADEAGLDGFLDFIGSRIVFLIDWNKARKALQTFIGRKVAIDLLSWAAAADFGHRAFLELGGADLVLEAVRRAAAGRVPYGVRLDGVLGAAETEAFLRRVLRATSENLAAGRSARLIRDEVQADLAQRFETAERAVLAILVRHLGLSRLLAARMADQLGFDDGTLDERRFLARRSKQLEGKADRLTLQARELCDRLQDRGGVRLLTDAVENAMDCLDQGAFLMSLPAAAPPEGGRPAAMLELAQTVVEAFSQMIRATQAASRLPEGRRSDAAAALQAIDAVTEAERRADAAERAAVAALMDGPAGDPRTLVLGLEVIRALETSTDHLAHAALALRDHVLEDISA